MAQTAQELLNELRQKQDTGQGEQTAQQQLDNLRTSQAVTGADQSGGFIDTLSRNVAQPFNRGLLALPSLLPGGDSLQADARNFGFLAPEGQEAEGFVPRSAEILGGGVLPGGAIAGLGKQVLARGIPLAQQSVLQSIGSQTAAHPAITAAGEIASAGSAGVAGEVAAQETDNPTIQTLAELAGGILGPLTATGAVTAAGKLANNLPSIVMGKKVMEAVRAISAPNRAAREVQSRAISPEESAARIDTASPMPPAKQAGDPRLLALEQAILKQSSPSKPESVQRHVEKTVDTAKKAATELGGDVTAPRAVVGQQGERTVKQATKRANKAVAKAEKALSGVDVDATPHDISRTVREKVKASYNVARTEERRLWGQIDAETVGNLNSTRKEVKSILAETGKFNKSKAVPKVVKRALALEDKLEAGETINFRDIHGLRQQVQDLKAKAITEPGKASEIRILTRLESAILKDMSATNAEGVTAARAFSRRLNDKFTRGKMGQVLGHSERALERVLDADTLSSIMSGQYPARNVEQLISASPGTKTDAAAFIRKSFILQATKDGAINKKAADRAIENLRSKRMFEVFPELEGQLANVSNTANRAKILKERAAILKERGGARLEKNSKESLASLFLEKPVGEETALLLDSKKVKNPLQLARKLVARMGGNQEALDGLKTSFARSLMDAAKSGKVTTKGEAITSGARYTKLLKDNSEVLRALGFEEAQIRRMRQTSIVLRQAEAKAGNNQTERIMTDPMGRVIDLVGAFAGAKAGAFIARKVGKGSAGVSLQAASRGASNLSQFMRWLSRDKARELLIAAHDDPHLYKSLLLRNSDTPKAQKEAWNRLNAWMIGVTTKDEKKPPTINSEGGEK